MKDIYNISKIGFCAICICCASLSTLYSCKDDFPVNVESDKITVLKSIKIVNAGKAGNEIIEGVVNEASKTVSFPRIDPETDLSAIKFEAGTSDGAILEQDTYAIPFKEGESESTVVIKITNSPRYREYLVKIRLKIPVYGADFTKSAVYDYTNNELGNPIYETFTGAFTRGTGFDGEHVLIVSRHAAGSHLLKVSDLKKNVINRIPLNMTGVALGTFTVNVGDIVNGHTYIANLSGASAASPIKIYHWTDPSVPPQTVANIDVSKITGAGVRHGDNMSVNLDKNGNGYIFLGDNAGTKVLRLKVSNYKTVGDPFVISAAVNVGSWSSFNQIGETDDYLFTGHDAPIMAVNSGGSVSYTLSRTAIPVRSSDSRVVEFNGERYLLTTTAARTGSEPTALSLYNITKGNNIVDALTAFEQSDRKPIYDYPLLGPVNTSPATQTGWSVLKDEAGKDKSLLIYTAASDAGFVIVEVPKKELED
ncbi:MULTISPECIES: DUF4623 domain-containing protein [Sphingobacterium]|uniref:DUF4623 domain-containing protein n=1 Tax=Sphingobacterium kitahiroshimense TaxID=470446 RepID=A0ABV0BSE7_9SPHI|nr:DUF4623 domain-containing protein [Sphingobacterium sp. JUb56]MBB2949929.1 hypothetical protein [Sphingobacterium sp. JUb56]